MGSVDVMPRNPDPRVEIPLLNLRIARRLRHEVLKRLADSRKSRGGQPDGAYEFMPANDAGVVDRQAVFLPQLAQVGDPG
jgi:polyphosphate kinase